MTKLVHEIWLYHDENGDELWECVLAGPLGDAARVQHVDRRLIETFEAGSHFEAMTIYNATLGRAPYTTTEAWDHRPYPEDWLSDREHCAGNGDQA